MFQLKKSVVGSAFTLVELLVVIAIIGLLASISIITLQGARAKARDARRIADAKQITTALEMFFNDAGRYPSDMEWGAGSLSFGSSTYLNTIPSAANPPDGTCDSGANQFSYTQTEAGASYTLTFCTGGNINSLPAGNLCASPGGIAFCGITCLPDCTNKCGGADDGCGGTCTAACSDNGYCDSGTCFYPSSLSSLQLWLKADAGVTSDGSNNVSAWADQSGNGNNIAQGNVTKEPLLVANQLNGNPVISFDGTNDYLTGGDILDLHQDGYSLFVVYNKAGTGWNTVVAKHSAGGLAGDWGLMSFSTTDYSTHNVFSGNISTSCTYDQTQFFVSTAIIDRATWPTLGSVKLYANGNLVSQTTGINFGTPPLPDYDNNTSFYVGAENYGGSSFFLKGSIAEIIKYNRNLSGTEQTQVENYLETKYGL